MRHVATPEQSGNPADPSGSPDTLDSTDPTRGAGGHGRPDAAAGDPFPVESARLRPGTPATVYAPSRVDPVVRSASVAFGGPAGNRLASSGRLWSAVTVLVLLACAMLGLGVVQKEHCRSNGWSSPDQFWHACYTDIPVLFASDDLGGAKAGANGAPAGTGRPDLTAALGSHGLG